MPVQPQPEENDAHDNPIVADVPSVSSWTGKQSLLSYFTMALIGLNTFTVKWALNQVKDQQAAADERAAKAAEAVERKEIAAAEERKFLVGQIIEGRKDQATIKADLATVNKKVGAVQKSVAEISP